MLQLLFSFLFFFNSQNIVTASADNNKIFFSNKSDFSTSTTEFDAGEKVYIKIQSTDLINLEGKNDLSLFDSNGSEELTGSFNKESESDFRANFIFPNNKDLHYLKIRLADNQGNNFELDTNLGSKYQFKKSRFFEDVGFKTEKDEFSNNEDIFYKGYLGNFNSDKITINIKNTKGEIKTVNGSNIVNRSDWLELDLYKGLNPFLYSKGLFSLIVKNTESTQTISKYFYINELKPVVSITFPLENTEVMGNTDIIGTAFSDDLDYYELKYQKNGDKDWISIKTAGTNVINGKLGTWDTNNLSNGNYLLSLVVKAKSGEEETTVKNLTAASFSGKFAIRIPTNAGLGTTKVSTSPQYIEGKVGSSNSRGISVQDDRGTFDGWSLTMTASDFYSGESVIDVSNLTVEPKDLVINKGKSDKVKLGDKHTFTGENDSTSIMYAPKDYGTGTYYSTLGINLRVPPNVVAGSYKAILYFTLL